MKYFYTIFNYKMNKIIFFVISGTTVFYMAGKYLKYSQFVFFSYEMNVVENFWFYEVVKYFFSPAMYSLTRHCHKVPIKKSLQTLKIKIKKRQ